MGLFNCAQFVRASKAGILLAQIHSLKARTKLIWAGLDSSCLVYPLPTLRDSLPGKALSRPSPPPSRKARETMEEIPECPVCLQSYGEDDQIIPRVLPCGHSACESCIKRLPRRFPNAISCPACTLLVRLPEAGGPSSLPKNIDLLRFISQTKPPPQSKTTCNPPTAVTRSVSPPGVRDSPSEFILWPWKEDFYLAWKGWLLPSDAVTVDERVGSEERFFSLCYGRTMNSSSSVSCLSLYSYPYLNLNQKVSLSYVTDSSDSNEFGFTPSYTARMMEALYRLEERERTALGFFLRACLSQRRVCRVYGFWMDVEDGSVFLVCERSDGELVKKLSESSCGFVGAFAVQTEEEEKKLVLEDGILGFADVGGRVCEVLMGLHSQDVACGCLALSCLSFDEHGCFSIDINDLLVTGRRFWRSITRPDSGQTTENGPKDDLGSADPSKFQAFVSPELFMLLSNEDVAVDYEGLRSSDAWSLGCLLVQLLMGGAIVDELYASFYSVLQKRTEQDISCEFRGMHAVWMEKVLSFLGTLLNEQFQSLLHIICNCLDYDPKHRPLVVDVWRCIRELLVNPHVDLLKGLDGSMRLEHDISCLVLRDLCLPPKKMSYGTRKKDMCDLQSFGGSNVTDVGQVNQEEIGKQLVDGLHSDNFNCVTLQGHLDCITGLAIGGGFLFSSSFDKTVHVWSLQDFSHVHSLKGHEHKVMAIAIMDSEKPLCISGDSGCGIFVWDIASLGQEPLKKWHEHSDWRYTGIHSLAVSGADYLYSGSGDKSIKAWSLQDYSLTCTMNGHKSVVSSLTVHSGILYSGSWDGTVRLWLLSDHSPLAVLGDEISGNFASVLSISADCHLLVASHENGCVKMWKNNVLIRSMQIHEGAVFATDMVGKWLFTGGWNRIVNVQELFEDEFQVDTQMAGTIVCESIVTALLYWQGKLFVGLSNKVIKKMSVQCTGISLHSHEGDIRKHPGHRKALDQGGMTWPTVVLDASMVDT
ncbi:hypothetical protein ACLOJK_014046 [Asimina triloba]